MQLVLGFATPVLQECWQVVCIAPHEEDYYHEKCIQKFMRAMPGKNYDPSRRSGLPCPRGVGKGTQYPVKCPCKVCTNGQVIAITKLTQHVVFAGAADQYRFRQQSCS
jgi:hypothetical protein